MSPKIVITCHDFDVLSQELKDIIHKMFAIDEYEFEDIFMFFCNQLTPRQRINLCWNFEKCLERVAPREEASGFAYDIYGYLDASAVGFLSLHDTITITPQMLSTVLENSLDYIMMGNGFPARDDMFDIQYEDSE